MVDYSVHLTDPEGNQFDVIDEWLELSYARTVNEPGHLTLVLPGDYDVELLRVDGRIGVFRDGRLELDTTWLVQAVTRELARDGTETVVVEGPGALDLLAWRVVAFNSGTSQADKAGYADDVMKEYVSENLGAGVSGTGRDLSAYINVEGDASLGPAVTKEAARQTLLATCQDLSQAATTAGSPVYFDLVAPTLSSLAFRTYRDLRGTNHSWTGGQNPVVLSVERGNLSEVSRTYDWSREATYVYAGGQGVADTRAVATASSPERIGRSVFGRREVFVGAQTSASTSSVQDEADAGLRRWRPTRTFDAELVSVTGTLYGVHWNWGDRVTAEYRGESIDCIIETVKVSVRGGQERIEAKLRVDED